MKHTFLIAISAAMAASAAYADSTIAKWTFDNQYIVINGVATPQADLQTSTSARNLHNVKLLANEQVGTTKMSLTPVRATREGQVGSQDDKGAYLEVSSAINANGAALHLTSPAPTPEEPSNTYMWGNTPFNFPDGNTYSYQNPYNYFELSLCTAKYTDIKINIKAAGHNSTSQYYVVAYSTDKSSWQIISDEYLTGNSYNQWTNNIIDLPIGGLEQAYVRIFPADNWKGAGESVSQDNQFNLDEVTVTGTITVERASIIGFTVNGTEAELVGSRDYLAKVAQDFADDVTTIRVATENATASATSDNAIVTAGPDNTFTIPTPEPNTQCNLTFKIAAVGEAMVEYDTYTLTIKREGVVALASLTIDGEAAPADVLSAINTPDAFTATLTDKVYTHAPEVIATALDGTAAVVTLTEADAVATYAIQVGDRTFKLNIEGVHSYNPTEADEILVLNYTRDGKIDENTWTDGLYTLTSNKLDGWNGSQFKFNSENSTLELPKGIVVKQFTLLNYAANYGNGEGLTSVTSEGATAYIPTKHQFAVGKRYDLTVTLENHTAGTPISFTIADTKRQPYASIQLLLEKTNPGNNPVLLSTDVAVSFNHAIVTLNYDREIQATAATINGTTITSEGGSAIHKYIVWGLDYDSNYTLNIPAGTAFDNFGNANAEDINIQVAVPSRPIATKSAYDYIVTSVDEFKAMVADLNTVNKNADAERKTVFICNGDYNFEGSEQRLQCYNVSLIGESRDGVVIRGTRNGISNPVLNLRDRSGFYLQDLTLRNDFNYGLEDKNTGQAVAVYGGNQTIMKNVRMLGNQDTQVTGEESYFDKCEIHGTVDFICGGGNNFYDQCDLIIEDRGGNVVAAPNTPANLKFGYVFSHCTISAIENAVFALDGTYHLGRPWQNEPRISYVYTKMNLLPAALGWTSMGTIPTHFYEYGSVDKDGNLIDLSVRGNSPTSTNTYEPILTKEQADFLTVENVLGAANGWLPTDYTTLTAAPVVTESLGVLSWENDPQVRATVIFKDGKYYANTAENSFTCTEPGVYTLRTANDMGGMSTEATTVTVENAGIANISADSDQTPACNIMGLPVDASYRGVVIKAGQKFYQR